MYSVNSLFSSCANPFVTLAPGVPLPSATASRVKKLLSAYLSTEIARWTRANAVHQKVVVLRDESGVLAHYSVKPGMTEELAIEQAVGLVQDWQAQWAQPTGYQVHGGCAKVIFGKEELFIENDSESFYVLASEQYTMG